MPVGSAARRISSAASRSIWKVPIQALRLGQRGDPVEHLVERQLAVAAGADHGDGAVELVAQAQPGGEHDRVAQRAAEPGL